MYALFRDGAEITLHLRVLRYEQNIASERMSDSEFQRHICIQSSEVNHDMGGTANLIPDRAQDVRGQNAITADIFDLRTAGLFDQASRAIRPCGAERSHMKATFASRIRILTRPDR